MPPCLICKSTEFSETPSPDSDSVNSLEGHSEPSWFKDIKFDDSDTEQLADEAEYTMPSTYLTSSISIKSLSFHLSPYYAWFLSWFQTPPAPARGRQSAASTQRWTATRLPPSTSTWSRTMWTFTSRSSPNILTFHLQPSRRVNITPDEMLQEAVCRSVIDYSSKMLGSEQL